MLHCALNAMFYIRNKYSSHIAIIRISLHDFQHLSLIKEEN